MLKGVNLGGWLVLERWITPSVFEGLDAVDETAFCLESGSEKTARLNDHRAGFITKEDFEWLAARGINAVRLPLPHWLFGSIQPYEAAVDFADFAMEECEKLGLKVILDVHTAPGSQNGRAHSGKIGPINWSKDTRNVAASLEFIEKLSERYGRHENLLAIELLNEPRAWTSPRVLKDYYQKGYEIVRRYCGDDVAVIISDYFSPWRWSKFMKEPDHKNVLRDSHLYQCHRAEDKKLDINQHLSKTESTWRSQIERMQKNHPVIIGEWSLALAPETFTGMDNAQKKAALAAYGQAQLDVFNQTAGWFYWTYKTESPGAWNFRYCVENGLLPKSFDSIRG